MWLRIALITDVRFVEEPLLHARILPNSVSSLDNADKMLNNEIKLLDKVYSNRSYSFSGWQRLTSYSYRYLSAAKSHKHSGRLSEARKYLGKAISVFPPIVFDQEVGKVCLLVLWQSWRGKNP